MRVEKAIVWIGTALDDLRSFPSDARHDAGFQLEQVQLGFDPDDWKPMDSVGAGCREIRIRTGDGAFRVFYLTKFGDQVYVLHCNTQEVAEDRTEGNRPRYQALRTSQEAL